MSVRSLRYNTIEQHFTKGVTASTDRDALAFLEAAQIYNTNQQRAIVNLVRSLKRVGLWTKMKAIYPFVGGTATSHKFNLKDPRDVDAAFRLTFSGGWTHNVNGITGNATNTYADTYIIPTNNLTAYNTALSVYIRNNTIHDFYDIASYTGSGSNIMAIGARYTGGNSFAQMYTVPATSLVVSSSDSRGFFMGNRTSNNVLKLHKNNSIIGTDTDTDTGFNALTATTNIGRRPDSPSNYTNRNYSFATIGDGLTDTDATNLYNIVQRYQFQLGRAIEPDAQAFIDAAGITDATQQAAILDLVVRLKNDGLWSKMKAIYPFVGGTASTHKWNLKDPRDVDAAFRLSFVGGWTHASTGALSNGTNGVAETFVNTSTNLTNSNFHISFYSRTNNTNNQFSNEIVGFFTTYAAAGLVALRICNKTSGTAYFSGGNDSTETAIGSTTSAGYAIGTETASNSRKFIKNNSILATNTTTSTTALNNSNLWLMGHVNTGKALQEVAFATIGDGLTDTDASNLYNIVDLYQKRLGRAV